MLTQIESRGKLFRINSFLEPMELTAKFCFRRKVTDDRGTHAEKKGPLYDATDERPSDEKQGWGNPGNGRVLDPAHAYVPVDRELTRTYFSRAQQAEPSASTLVLKG